jgi:tRNA(Arg) A34 adenosine deaminase TadA
LPVHDIHMQAALDIARRGLAAGEPPIGAVVVRDGVQVSRAHNSVISLLDATAHAEIVAIRESCHELRALQLTDCDLYSTVEPCPMCLAACHYAGIANVYFGASLDEMQSVTGNELTDCAMNGVAVHKVGGVMREECLQLLHEWAGSSRL